VNGERHPIVPGPLLQDPGEPFNLQLTYDRIVQLSDARTAAAKSGDLSTAKRIDAEIRKLDDAIDRAVHSGRPQPPPAPQPRPPAKGEENKLSRGLEALQRQISRMEGEKRAALNEAASSLVPDFSKATAIDGDIQVLAHQAGQIRGRLEEIDRWNVRAHQMKRQDQEMREYRAAEARRKEKLAELRQRIDEIMPMIDAIKALASEAHDDAPVRQLVEALGGR
jgi:hypothetical protein